MTKRVDRQVATPDVNALLGSTRPILYETGSDEWPYAYSGSCFPVKFRRQLFVVSAFHCYVNFGIEPEQTLYPRPDAPSGFFGFDLKVRAEDPGATDKKHADQIVLRVARRKHAQGEMDTVAALDLADPARTKLPTSRRVSDILLRGYPFDCPRHAINYDECSIRHQAYVTNGVLGRTASKFKHCYSVKMITPIPEGMSPNGMSGTPVYGIACRLPVFCGMIIEYNSITKEYLAVGPEVLVNSLRQLCGPEGGGK